MVAVRVDITPAEPILYRELNLRENRRLNRLLQLARLRQLACVEDIDYTHRRGLERSLMATLVTCGIPPRLSSARSLNPGELSHEWTGYSISVLLAFISRNVFPRLCSKVTADTSNI
jgi:hypothetical protein